MAATEIDVKILAENHATTITLYKLTLNVQKALEEISKENRTVTQKSILKRANKILKCYKNKSIVHESDRDREAVHFYKMEYNEQEYVWLNDVAINDILPLLKQIGEQIGKQDYSVQPDNTQSLITMLSEMSSELENMKKSNYNIRDTTPSTIAIRIVEKSAAAETDKQEASKHAPISHNIKIDEAPSFSATRSFESVAKFFTSESSNPPPVELTNKVHHGEIIQLFFNDNLCQSLWQHFQNFFLTADKGIDPAIPDALLMIRKAIMDNPFKRNHVETDTTWRHIWWPKDLIDLISKQLAILKSFVTSHTPQNSLYKQEKAAYLACFGAVITYLEQLLNLQKPNNREQNDGQEKRKYAQELYGAVRNNNVAWETCGCKHIHALSMLEKKHSQVPAQGQPGSSTSFTKGST